jgi:D-alanyl-D-alanine carboxypeptidase
MRRMVRRVARFRRARQLRWTPRSRWSAVAVAALTCTSVVAASVGAIDVPIGSGAAARERADRIQPEVVDVVTVFNSGELTGATEAAATAAARQAGSDVAISGSASIAMQRIRRGTADVQVAPSTMSIPMATTVLDNDVISALMGADVSTAMSDTAIVMGAKTASLRGAQAGDSVSLRSSSGEEIEYTIGAVVADDITGGTELLMTWEAAARINLSRRGSVLLWGFASRAAIDQALADNGLVSTKIRIRRSWDAPDPDSTIGMASTKVLLGEFAYRVNADGSVTQESAWQQANLPPGRVLLNTTVAISARCHKVVEPALRAALAEIVAAGAGGVFNVGDANTAGGCHNPRFSTLSQNSSIGFLSRHSWAMAIDTNTRGSCQGCAPPDIATLPGGCAAVRIFRKHGFAWGGNFLTPDGMHFEYVGERRDQLSYPSRYCPNIVAGNQLTDTDSIDAPTQRATLFVDAGLIVE